MQQEQEQDYIEVFDQTVKVIKQMTYKMSQHSERFHLESIHDYKQNENYQYKIIRESQALINTNWSINLLNQYCNALKQSQSKVNFQPCYLYYHI